MQIISNIALITINETLFIQLISFLIFVYILNKIMIRPLRSVMAEREHDLNEINIGINEAEKKLSGLSSETAENEKNIRKEVGLILKQIEEAARDDADKIIASAWDEIAILRDDAEKKISEEISRAQKSLEPEAEKLSIIIMETILDRRIS